MPLAPDADRGFRLSTGRPTDCSRPTGVPAATTAALERQSARSRSTSSPPSWLLENELVDELNLIQFPVIVGESERVFPHNGLDFNLQLTDPRVFGSGIVGLTY